MGEHEGWAQGGGAVSPNGLLPNAGPLIEVLDTERWIKAEERTAELIACIQPNQPSEERRNAVADYVQRLIMKCFHCQVFTFGSVPLKTYLPDGDIDLTAFSDDPNLKHTWATEVRDMLELEEKNKNAEFNVKEVQYIQAEVKIIKCLVENIVVDISFNQLGGLCTLCFLEEVDHLINQNHLFKRSIILIKAWCYYESRILGAHHGLISTYALETLVLYIFHVYNNSFSGPLEVLFRFLEFFSNFDWDNFCVSLWGPVPISSLPDVNAEPPRKDSGELLLSKPFLEACSHVYAVYPTGQENQVQPFLSKSFNVIDPLRITNNLGRSVSKGNFFRIRSALGYGAKRLARLLHCPKENLVSEVNKFFHNTWDRHGSGVRPDAPDIDLRFGLSKSDNVPDTEIGKNIFNVKNESSGREAEVEETRSHNFIHQNSNFQSESMSKSVDNNASLRTQSQKSFANLNNSRMLDQNARGVNSKQLHDKELRTKSDQLVNDIQRFLFARTRSSPELTDSYGDASSQGRRNRTSESGKSKVNPAELNSGPNSHYRNRKKNLEPEQPSRRVVRTSDDASSGRHAPMHQSVDTASDSNSKSNHYHPDSSSGAVNEELSSTIGTQGMHQEEQDLVNMMASLQGFNGQIHMPMNLPPGHLPFPGSPSFLASMGFTQRNMAGMLPTNFPLINPAFSNLQFPHGLVSPQLAQYFSGIGMAANSEDSVDPGNRNSDAVQMNSGDADNDFWQEPDMNSPGGIEPENGNVERLRSDDKPKSSSTSFNYIPPPRRVSGVGGLIRGQQKNTKEKRGPMREDHSDHFQYQDNRSNEAYPDERASSSRFSSAAHSNSLRSKTSSESSWDEPSTVSKGVKEKRGKKLLPLEQSTGYAKGKTMAEQISMPLAEDNDPDWNPPSPHVATEMVERSSGPQSLAPMHVSRPHIPGYEIAQTSGSDSMTHMPPMILDPGSRQRIRFNDTHAANDNSTPLTFYPTGPPVPFLTMLPFNYVQSESGTSDASTSHFGAEESSENGDVGQNFHSSEGVDPSEDFSTNDSLRGAAPGETSEEQHKSDILNSDFITHYQNLQFGRSCQSPMPQGPAGYPSPVMVPPMYLQGRVPWDGPGRPLSANMNFFTQLMNYGPRLVPVSPLQSVSNRPPNVYQRYADDLPRHRTGTGTYLPNPKVSPRDRHSSGPRRGNYNYDRIDNHGDREGNWSGYQRSRPANRNHNRNQAEKSSSRMDRLAAGDNRAERPVSSPRLEAFPSYPSQNGPLRPSSSQSGPANVAYGMYPLPAGNPSGLSPNGQNGPSVVMVYPYDHNGGYVSHNEQLEFGSMGPMGFSGTNDQSTLSEGSRSRGSLEEHRYYGGSTQRSSPDQPSSPHHQRRI